MMETEVEEGEAHVDDIDPDTALSYIDKRLQHALGHFQKDFEGGVSSESLGPRFGGYGSFLPSYKHPPAIHSHRKVLNLNNPSPLDNLPLEGAHAPLNLVACADLVKPAAPHHGDAFVDQNVLSADDKARKDTSLLHGETSFSKKETATSNSVIPTEQRSLKVRIKVGYDKPAIKNDEIYSGLGLLTPSPSTDNNPEGCGGPPIESHDIPFDSPGSILGDMMAIFVPGNRLLSPLNENLICLKLKVMPVIGRKTSTSVVDDSSSVLGEVKRMEGKEVSSLNKSEGFEEHKAPVSEKGMKTESADCKQGLTNDLKVKLSCDSIISEANRAAKNDVPLKKRETKKELINDLLFGSDFTSKKSDESYDQKSVKKFSSDSIISEANRAAKKDIPLKKRGRKKESISSVLSGPDHTSKESNESYEQKNVKKLSLDSRGIRKIVCQNDIDVIKHETDPFEKTVCPKATTCEPQEVKISKNIEKLPSERKSKLTGNQTKENLRYGLSGTRKDKKSALRDIVKVRNSYKDILDGAIEVATVERNGVSAEVAVPQQTEVGLAAPSDRNGIWGDVSVSQQIEVGPVVPPDNWVGCDRCEKWRLLPIGIEPDNLPDKWLCSMSTWLPGRNHCDISEDETTRAVQEMNHQLIFQNQNSLQFNGTRGNIGNSDHANSIVTSDIMANKFEKLKSRPEGSGCSLIETSHSLMDAQQHARQKRKGLTETNQLLLERNGVVKAKKLKSKTWSDQHETVTSNKIKNESEQLYSSIGDHRPKDRLVISVKGHTENTPVVSMESKLLDKKVEIPAKKRKLKDWQESQNANTLESSEDRTEMKDKRPRTGVKESTDDRSFNKGKSMKIRLSASKENLVDTNHEKLSNKKVEIPAKKRKLKDWQDSQPCTNMLDGSEDIIKKRKKRLKTEVKESTDDISLNKGKTMKIKLSASRENLVDTSHEKNQQHREKINCKKDLESEQCMLVATSSSKISGSCRRASLREQKGSPARSVSSSSIRALNPDDISPDAGKTIPRKAHVRTEISRKDTDASKSQRSGGKVDVKPKEVSKIKSSHIIEHATGHSDVRMGTKVDANGAKDDDKRSNLPRIIGRASDPLTGQPNKTRKVEVDVGAKIINDGKKHAGSEAKLSSLEINPTVKKDLEKVYVGDMSYVKDSAEPKVEVQTFDDVGQNQSKAMKRPGDAVNQNAQSLVTDCGTVKDLGVISFLKEYSSTQTALTPFKRAEESKDYADRLKISGFEYECNDAYFDSALKFLYAASLLEACTADVNKSKGMDPISGYTTSAKLSKVCAQEYEKRKEAAAAALAYKCMEVAYMRIVYCKSLLTRQDLQTSMQMVTQGESPSSSASDVDNLNNQPTTDKTLLSKNITPLGNTLVRNQANLMRLLDLTSDVSLAMEASTKSQNAYKAASATLEESQNNEIMISVKRVVDFSFQDVKEIVCLVQNTREAINRQGFKGNNRR